MQMRRSQRKAAARKRGEPRIFSKLLSCSIRGWLELNALGEHCVSGCFNKAAGRARMPTLSVTGANSQITAMPMSSNTRFEHPLSIRCLRCAIGVSEVLAELPWW